MPGPKTDLMRMLRGALGAPADDTAVRGHPAPGPVEPPSPEQLAAERAQTLADAAAMIERHEGFRPRAYRDAAGHLTIGFGQRIPTTAPQETTREEARKFLMGRVQRDADYLEQRGIKLSPGMLSALYNIGTGNAYEYGITPALQAGEYARAADILEKVVKAKGQVLPGLVKRRKEESMSLRRSAPGGLLSGFLRYP